LAAAAILLAPVCGTKAGSAELDPVPTPVPVPFKPPVVVLAEVDPEEVVNALTLPYRGGLRGWLPAANTFDEEGVIAGRKEEDEEAVEEVDGG
jgi:hypothetical protein